MSQPSHLTNGHSPPSDAPHAPRAHSVSMADVPLQRVSWLWPGRIPRGKLTILDGDPGLGKSCLTLDLAARISTGSTMPDGFQLDGPAGVIVLTAEDDAGDTVRPRLEAAGADLSRVRYLPHMEVTEDGKLTQRPWSLPGDIDALREIVDAYAVALVIIDPLSAFLSARVDSHRDQGVRGALFPLTEMAAATGAAVIGIRHLNKDDGGHALYRGGGSIAIIGAARAGLIVGADPGDETEQRRILAVTKLNVDVAAPALAYSVSGDEDFACARIVWHGTTGHTANDLLGQDRASDALDAASQWLGEFLTDGPAPASVVKAAAEATNTIAWRTVQRAKHRLGVKSKKRDGPSAPWEWSLPTASSEEPTTTPLPTEVTP